MRGVGFLAMMATLAWGCAGSPPSSEYNSQVAHETLVAALDAWKQGRANQLAKRQPPIRLADDDLRSGCRLLDYTVSRSDFGAFENVSVTLKLLAANGKPSERIATYQVALSPSFAVMRSD